MDRRRHLALIAPTLMVLLMAVLKVGVHGLLAMLGAKLEHSTVEIVESGLAIAFWLSVAWWLSRLMDITLWGTVERRTGLAAPRLLVAVGRLLIAGMTVAVVLSVVFEKPLTGVLVSSGAVGVVVGFALQRMISDFFSGIALSMEAPFRVGDWIEVDGVTGRVLETNWRATHLVTLEDVTIIVPNSLIGEKRFLNYDKPLGHFRAEIPVSLEYSVQIPDAKRVLLAAARAVEGVLESPEPDVLVKAFNPEGVLYRVRYFVRSYRDRDKITDAVATSVSRHLWQAGFNIPYPKMDLHHAPMPPRDVDRKSQRDALLSRIELFEGLPSEELRELASALVERRCRPGQDIVTQGQPGSSLFLVVEGLLEAHVHGPDHEKAVGRIGPGEFFGEMSLLTGSPRAATVTATTDAFIYELSHEVVSPMLQRKPALVETLSQLIAQRRMRMDATLAKANPAQNAATQRTLTEELRRRIRGFFRME